MRKELIYISAYIFIYIISALTLIIVFHNPAEDILAGFFSFGASFSLIAYLLTKNIESPKTFKPAFKNETFFLFLLICWLILYTTFASGFIDGLLPASILQDERLHAVMILARKLLVFVIVPFMLYKLAGFPLLFIWLMLEVGLVEEFFFRALLQSRITVLLKSTAGGILISGLIFGLAHAPGLYLRGFGKTEGITESLPFSFWAAYTICTMSLAGIFIGIIWHKTRNLYLIMAIHVMVDLIPNFAGFVHTWKL